MPRVDLEEARELIKELADLADELDGAAPNIENDKDRARMRKNAERSRKLLYAGHLCEKLKVEFDSEYFTFRGIGS